jgi:hypothetical protein
MELMLADAIFSAEIFIQTEAQFGGSQIPKSCTNG